MPLASCGVAAGPAGFKEDALGRNIHPTVKPADLMHHLCVMICPPGGLIVDPFAGSGTTGIGAVLGNFRFSGIELDSKHVEIALKRIKWWAAQYE
jgi:site-specific DNA-methyltransferase (adenine-specific)